MILEHDSRTIEILGPRWKMKKFFMPLLLAALALFAPPHALADTVDVHELPLGDGKISSAPERGYVMSCTTSFSGGGALATAPWIHGDSWDLTQKISVRGKIVWPQAQFEITTADKDRVVSRIVRGNGLPLKAATGTFPIAQDDPAYQIDRNPNTIVPNDIVLKLPMMPQFAAEPSCVPMGMIAVGLNGVAIFNALDGGGRDAVAHEVQDLCNGHPQPQGQYHYHGPSPCLPNQAGKEMLIGYALDGFGIYSMYDAQGHELTDADLDGCHGRTSKVEWNGARRVIYHYVLTQEYPYTIGCFRGSPVQNAAGK
jgi:YHYH protein